MNAQEATAARQEAIEKLGSLIDDVRVTMMTTVDPQSGALHSRPMATQQTAFDGTLWFFTGKDSHKVEEVEEDHDVNLAYAEPDDNHYVSVSGTARLVTDQGKMEELWHPVLKAWFPGGLDDPDLALLKVDVEQAEYWDSAASTLVKITGFVKALATGERYDAGENEKLDL